MILGRPGAVFARNVSCHGCTCFKVCVGTPAALTCWPGDQSSTGSSASACMGRWHATAKCEVHNELLQHVQQRQRCLNSKPALNRRDLPKHGASSHKLNLLSTLASGMVHANRLRGHGRFLELFHKAPVPEADAKLMKSLALPTLGGSRVARSAHSSLP